MVRDQIALVSALGYRSTAMMVGHDQGSLLAALGALIRPDMFPRLTLIGGGFGGAPSFPFNTANGAPVQQPAYTNAELDEDLTQAARAPACQGLHCGALGPRKPASDRRAEGGVLVCVAVADPATDQPIAIRRVVYFDQFDRASA